MAETPRAARQGQVFVTNESTYGTAATQTATDAVRHTEFSASANPYNRVNSPEKKQSPGVVNRFDRRGTASWSLKSLLRPSGTLNTLCEANKLLKAGFGAESNITLSTTVVASPAPTTTSCTVASAAGLVKGQAILITVSAVKYVRFLTNVATAALTWAPALPGAPVEGAAVKGCVTYGVTSALALPLSLAHYSGADAVLSRIVKGAVVDTLGIAFGHNGEPVVSFAGPAKSVTTPAPTKPVAFTAVGTQNPPSGLTGGLYVGSALYRFEDLDIQIANGLELDMDNYGSADAYGILPRHTQAITLGLNAKALDESVIYDNAESGTPVAIMKQTGFTEGNIVGIYAPLVDFDVPDRDDGDTIPKWAFKGVCKESSDSMNDALYLALA